MSRKAIIFILTTLSVICASVIAVADDKEQLDHDQSIINSIIKSEAIMGGLGIIFFTAANYAISNKVDESITKNISPVLGGITEKVDSIAQNSQEIKLSISQMEGRYALLEQELEDIKEKLNEQKKEYTEKIGKLETELDKIEQMIAGIRGICPIK